MNERLGAGKALKPSAHERGELDGAGGDEAANSSLTSLCAERVKERGPKRWNAEEERTRVRRKVVRKGRTERERNPRRRKTRPVRLTLD